MANKQILIQAAGSFQFDLESLVFVSHTCNEVYRFTKEQRYYFLRITEKPISHLAQIEAELNWIKYLAHNGVRASRPITTGRDEWAAVYEEQEQCVIAVAFEQAAGVVFDKHNPQLWGPELFSRWGETMGRMHLLAKDYPVPATAAKRSDWVASSHSNPHLQHGRYQLLLAKLQAMESAIALLPRDRDAYGLIHQDFHPYNFHIDKGMINVFDFDDSIYGWFAMDIAIAAAHAVWWGSPAEDRVSKQRFALLFLQSFMSGYRKYNQLDKYWLEQIPMFMDYRNISSYFWWLGGWNGDETNLSTFQ